MRRTVILISLQIAMLFLAAAYALIPKVSHSDADVAALISIQNPQDVARLRSELITFLWGTELPSSLPTVERAFSDDRYDSAIEKLVVHMDFGLESHVYHFIPEQPNNKVVLYHQGHSGDFYKSKKQIKILLDNGYAVVAFSMPLLGLNNQPTIELPRIGPLKLSSHDHMRFLAPEQGHPVRYFIEPVIVVLNYLEGRYDSISMVGISGGGWTTTLAAAIDARIDKSFPVAGTYPLYLRENRDWGDYEQNVPELYQTVNYLELYILGRKQLQIINQYDPCCFAGTQSEAYRDIVATIARQVGNDFDVFIDDSHRKHAISDVAMERILRELNR